VTIIARPPNQSFKSVPQANGYSLHDINRLTKAECTNKKQEARSNSTSIAHHWPHLQLLEKERHSGNPDDIKQKDILHKVCQWTHNSPLKSLDFTRYCGTKLNGQGDCHISIRAARLDNWPSPDIAETKQVIDFDGTGFMTNIRISHPATKASHRNRKARQQF
jgi:hypothetical protein